MLPWRNMVVANIPSCLLVGKQLHSIMQVSPSKSAAFRPIRRFTSNLVQRRIAQLTLLVFFISSIFPLVAAFVHDPKSWPKWWGVADVSLAFLLVLLVLVVQVMARYDLTPQVEKKTYRLYRIAIHGILLFIVVFFIFGDRIIWNQCLTGFAWRSWLLLYALPWWFASADNKPPSSAYWASV